MKNRIIAITSTGLNLGTYQVYNCEMKITSTGKYDVGTRPTVIYFRNTSGIEIEFNFITRQELQEFQTSETNFAGVRLKANEYFIQRDIIGKELLEPQPTYLLIKGVSGSVSGALDIYCLNYV